MYGTVARMIVKPGMGDQLMKIMSDDVQAGTMNGYINTYLYQADSNPDEYWMAVSFENRETYHANAQSPEMHQIYLKYRELLAAEPEWHDGEIVWGGA